MGLGSIFKIKIVNIFKAHTAKARQLYCIFESYEDTENAALIISQDIFS